MRTKKPSIVIYFGKEKNPTDPFHDFGIKRKVYYELFQYGLKSDMEMYISSGRCAYKGNLIFENLLKFENGSFTKHSGSIAADAVYDRSGGLEFPPEDISHKVLNGASFKKLCADKNASYAILSAFMPKSLQVRTSDEMREALSTFPPNALAVLKPENDFGGKGIFIDYPEKLHGISITRSYVLQEFIDTSGGIDGIVNGPHDLRIVIVEGDAILAHVRTPREGSLLANVAQGGSLHEVSLNAIPHYIMESVHKIQNIIDSKYNKPLYSIDFGIMDKKAYVFELNDQIGFPSEVMHSRVHFLHSIIASLKRLSEN